MAFYMSTYLMDTIFFMTPFSLRNWSWNITCPKPIHQYYSKLWEENEKKSFYNICHFVVIPIHKKKIGCDPPCISDAVSNKLKKTID
jgi:hypothetical protein